MIFASSALISSKTLPNGLDSSATTPEAVTMRRLKNMAAFIVGLFRYQVLGGVWWVVGLLW